MNMALSLMTPDSNALHDMWLFLSDANHWQGSEGIAERWLTHLWVSGAAVAAAAVLALPPAAWLAHRGKGRGFALAFANLSRAIPSLAILALVVAFGGGVGFLPTWVAMLALAVPPLFVGALLGMSEIDPAVLDAARGMGLAPWQVLTRVRWPLALPLLLSGLRVASSQVIATAALGAFVGYNTLGRYITVGRANQDDGMLYAGVLIIVASAVAIDTALRQLTVHIGGWREH